MEINELDLTILEAIKMITSEASGYRVSYTVSTTVEKDLFRKEGIKKVSIDITLSKRV